MVWTTATEEAIKFLNERINLDCNKDNPIGSRIKLALDYILYLEKDNSYKDKTIYDCMDKMEMIENRMINLNMKLYHLEAQQHHQYQQQQFSREMLESLKMNSSMADHSSILSNRTFL